VAISQEQIYSLIIQGGFHHELPLFGHR
jgi:hypothetical protein